jgi:hypothetical protein
MAWEAINFLAHKCLGGEQIVVVLDSEQYKVCLVEETHDEQENLIAIVELEERVGFVECTLVGGGPAQSSRKHVTLMLVTC